MEDSKSENEQITTRKRKINFRRFFVSLILVIFIIIAFISNRAEYLKIKEIGENYTSIFFTNFYMKMAMFIVAFLIIYISVFINNKIIKKGLKEFFNQEEKIMPKLPNKSIALIFGIVAGVFALRFLYTKYIVCINAASFGKVDPIFGYDLGFYMFILPFIKLCYFNKCMFWKWCRY